jgi:hypothetical protein
MAEIEPAEIAAAQHRAPAALASGNVGGMELIEASESVLREPYIRNFVGRRFGVPGHYIVLR